jgi:hypothetical protein
MEFVNLALKEAGEDSGEGYADDPRHGGLFRVHAIRNSKQLP